MIQKARKTRKGKQNEPLEVRLSVKYRFGDDDDETVIVMDDRRIPMVGGVFKYRDRIVRGFTTSLVKAGASQPKVMRELMPLLRLFKRGDS